MAVGSRSLPQNRVIRDPVTVWDFTGAASVPWTNGNGTVTDGDGRTKTGTGSAKLTATTNAFSIRVRNIDSAAMDFNAHHKRLGIWVYLDNPAEDATCTCRVFLGNDATNPSANAHIVIWTSNHRKNSWTTENYVPIRSGWNYVDFTTHDPEFGNPNGNNAPTTGDKPVPWMTFQKQGTGFNRNSALKSLQFQINNAQDSGVNGGPFPFYIDRIELGLYTRPCLVIGFDSNSTSVSETAKSYLDLYGYKAYIAITEGNTHSGDPKVRDATKIDRMRGLYNAGWELVNHTRNHTNMTTVTEDQDVIDEVEWVYQLQKDLGFKKPTHNQFFLYPSSVTDTVAKRLMAERFPRMKAARSIVGRFAGLTSFGLADPMEVGGFNFGGNTYIQVKDYVNRCVAYGNTGFLFGHDLVVGGDQTAPPASNLEWYENDFRDIMAYVRTLEKKGLIDVLTPSEWYDTIEGKRLTRRDTPVAVEGRLAVTR